MNHFDRLFELHYKEIFLYISKICPEHADDLVQETFMTLYEHIEQIEGQRVRAWLYRVAMNKSLDWMRSHKRRQKRNQDAGERYYAGGIDHSNPEQSALLRLAMEHLEPRQQQLLCLHHSGLNYEELADVLSVSKASISKLLVRAKRAFVSAYQSLSLDSSE